MYKPTASLNAALSVWQKRVGLSDGLRLGTREGWRLGLDFLDNFGSGVFDDFFEDGLDFLDDFGSGIFDDFFDVFVDLVAFDPFINKLKHPLTEKSGIL